MFASLVLYSAQHHSTTSAGLHHISRRAVKAPTLAFLWTNFSRKAPSVRLRSGTYPEPPKSNENQRPPWPFFGTNFSRKAPSVRSRSGCSPQPPKARKSSTYLGLLLDKLLQESAQREVAQRVSVIQHVLACQQRARHGRHCRQVWGWNEAFYEHACELLMRHCRRHALPRQQGVRHGRHCRQLNKRDAQNTVHMHGTACISRAETSEQMAPPGQSAARCSYRYKH